MVIRDGGAEEVLACFLSPQVGLRGLARAVEEGTLGARLAAPSTRALLPEARRILERARSAGMEVRWMGGAGYPDSLRRLPDPPPILYLRGDATLLDSPMVGVVGARSATAYGLRMARWLGEGLARRGLTVVSGLARGVDGAAHSACLEAGGGTVAVLGTGADVAYPARHHRLQEAIAARGLLVTEFPPGTRAQGFHFPQRNRILATLCLGVVVVEARVRSGALITARHAMEMGREVMAIPGPVGSDTSEGTNALIRDGAQLVMDLDWIVEVLGQGRVAPSPSAPSQPAALAPEEASVWRALGDGPGDVDHLLRQTALPPARLLAAVSALEVEGWVERGVDGLLSRRLVGAP